MNAIPTKVDDNRFITDFDQKRVSIFENPGVLFGSSGVNSREFHFACWKWKKKKKKEPKCHLCLLTIPVIYFVSADYMHYYFL